MNWYRAIKIAQCSGEFWIQGRNVEDANIDIGEYSHEARVVDYLKSQFMDNSDEDFGEWLDGQAREVLNNDLQRARTDDQRDRLNNLFLTNINSFILRAENE